MNALRQRGKAGNEYLTIIMIWPAPASGFGSD